MPIYETEIKPHIIAINAIVNVINVASIWRKVPAKFLSMQRKQVNHKGNISATANAFDLPCYYLIHQLFSAGSFLLTAESHGFSPSIRKKL